MREEFQFPQTIPTTLLISVLGARLALSSHAAGSVSVLSISFDSSAKEHTPLTFEQPTFLYSASVGLGPSLIRCSKFMFLPTPYRRSSGYLRIQAW
jgi:hypothetical protein